MKERFLKTCQDKVLSQRAKTALNESRAIIFGSYRMIMKRYKRWEGIIVGTIPPLALWRLNRGKIIHNVLRLCTSHLRLL